MPVWYKMLLTVMYADCLHKTKSVRNLTFCLLLYASVNGLILFLLVFNVRFTRFDIYFWLPLSYRFSAFLSSHPPPLPPSFPPFFPSSLHPFLLPYFPSPSPHTHTHHLSSRKFYSELTQCETSAVGVCRCFIRSGPDFHCYVPYICNLANGVSVLSQYGGTFFEDLQRENRDGTSLMQHYTRWVEFNN